MFWHTGDIPCLAKISLLVYWQYDIASEGRREIHEVELECLLFLITWYFPNLLSQPSLPKTRHLTKIQNFPSNNSTLSKTWTNILAWLLNVRFASIKKCQEEIQDGVNRKMKYFQKTDLTKFSINVIIFVLAATGI